MKKKNTDEWFLMFLLMVNDVNKYKNWSTKNIEAYRLAATCKKGHFDALLRDAFFPWEKQSDLHGDCDAQTG